MYVLAKSFLHLILPFIYNCYMWLVYNTSKKTYIGVPRLWEMTACGENVLFALWHQDAFIGPFCLRGHSILTMISHSDLGDIISRVLLKSDFIPIRGGSKKGGKAALELIIQYMKTHSGVPCGIAVDGSRGPARKAKIGALLIARATGAPIYPMRIWAKRCLFAPTWDKTSIPLPWNHLLFTLGEAIVVPSSSNEVLLEILRSELERRLNELAKESREFFRNRIENLNLESAEL